jgi:hypothetical protein
MPAKGEAEKPDTGKKYARTKEMSYRQALISLVIGDVMVFIIFVIIGDTSHGQLNGLASVPQIVLIALPFIAGWFIVSPFIGMFRRDIFTQPRAMAIRTIWAWIPAWVIAMLLLGIFQYHAVPPTPFMIVALVFNLTILEIWRWPFAVNNAARKRGA